MSQANSEDGDPYMLGRNYVASGRYASFRRAWTYCNIRPAGLRSSDAARHRLALLHLLIRAQFGYLLHPKISKSLPAGNQTEGLRIADVGTGTGYSQIRARVQNDRSLTAVLQNLARRADSRIFFLDKV